MERAGLPGDVAAQFERDGCYYPIDALTEEEAAACVREYDEACKTVPPADLRVALNGYPHVVMPLAGRVARHPAVAAAAAAVLGPNVLAWGAQFFVKEPHTDTFVAPHQDLFDNIFNHALTAFVALTPCNRTSGCLSFWPGTHVLADKEGGDERGDPGSVGFSLDDGRSVYDELRPGQLSLHHGRCFHGSGPNKSDHRRIALAIRYISTDNRQTSAARPWAMLACGVDEHGHYELVEPPADLFAPQDVKKVHELADANNNAAGVYAAAFKKKADDW